ncbi:ATP-dependent helicase [Aneurinibacillus migulanus]|uniref:ATP-dependent helicase n=1 Tax=Aneurinibacillus migulanus TaxID=47500 RepID=A0A0D1Y193_ANEMI|nr:SNF2-related protein [Aneurinibacillus migulanus]KIV54835.1 ATP-dependent helicase [Aneurinibacillus migulanus]KIV58043.1 ATP-dependent helicase [Aneurinibacillus migulanus]KON95530.1 ATP-dependent helicase [Aneurinibacillus migulanus]KPD06264.1 ATP-dependent helicase [Aneurinibacillus migulanus]MCP1355873.1 DEAD/DEAH box helicase [Aneurinibacillus migulanus]
MTEIPITFQRDWIDHFKTRVQEDGPWHHRELYRLAWEATHASAVSDFNELQCLRHLPHLTPLPHQIETAQKVICDMHGRALLADEVGLGKTIEAGLILKEYMVRGLVKKVLILVPASLVVQWVRELNSKFSIPAVAQRKEYMWTQYDIIVASIDTAKRPPHREIVLNQPYDLVIIDEAHKLKNKNTKNYQFIQELKKKYCLLLTATPIQNELDELYNLITLLKPGHLGQSAQFQQSYVEGKRQVKNNETLKNELKKIMVRNRRSDGKVEFTARHVITVPIELSAEERHLYESVSRFVQEQYHGAEGGYKNPLALITLQREICSSRDAAFMTLVHMHNRAPESSPLRRSIVELIEQLKQVSTNQKAEKVIDIIKETDDKVIIFTEYRATQEYLQHILAQHGITSVLFRGGFKRSKKDWMSQLFEQRAQVLIATEAGGEGINLQFCNRLINYDMPWNPMRVEQRIGRIHRLGQTRDVYIYNLATQGTIEEKILNLLYEKINLFKMVIGELETIIDRLHLNKSLEKNVIDILLSSKSEGELTIKMDNLSQVIQSVQNSTDSVQKAAVDSWEGAVLP